MRQMVLTKTMKLAVMTISIKGALDALHASG